MDLSIGASSDAPLQITEAAALSDETRVAMVQFMADAGAPVSIAALTTRFGLHHSTVRQHLARLQNAGLVEVETEVRSRRGRPRALYRVTPRAAVVLGAPGAYERLAQLLAEVVRSGLSPREVGRCAGRSAASRRSTANFVTSLEREMAEQGFRPTVRERSNGTDVVLRACPYVSVVGVDPQTICGLHLGWVEGFSEHASDVQSVGLTVHDAREAGCVIQLGGIR